MHKITTATLLGIAAAAWTAPAGAQDIYRCGDSYSQQPCAGGKLVAASDSRTAAQKSQTDAATRRDAKTAEAMEKARLKEEAKPVSVGMPLPKAQEPASAQKPTKGAAKKKKPEHFTAIAPGKPDDAAAKKKKKKAADAGA